MLPPSPHVSVVIDLSGELDELTAPAIREDLIVLASVVHAPEIVVDLTEVTSSDSAGLKPLIVAQNLLLRRDRKLKLLGVPRSAAALIRATGLGGSLNVHDIATRDDRPTPAPALPVQRASSERH